MKISLKGAVVIIASMIIILSVNCFFSKTFATDNITDSPTFYVDGGETEAGNNVMVTVYASSIKGISAANIKIKYDENIEFIEFKNDASIENIIASNNNNELAIVFNNNKDIKGMFEIGTILFKTPDNAEPNKNYELKISEVDKILSVSDGEIVNFYTQNSNISILEPIKVEESIIKENADNSSNNIKKIIITGTIIFIIVAIICIIIISKIKKKKNNN